MTIRHIRIFLEVCRTMNVTRAAENLYMTQPAVSRSIHEIEQVYGVRLFERLNQRLYLTDSGRRMRAYAVHIVDTFDQMERELSDGDERGMLRIGASITLGNYELPGVVRRMKQERPSLRLQATVANVDTLKELSAALGNDPNFATTVATQIGQKVDKVAGKGLSTEDYTSEEKAKLAGVAAGANNYQHPATHPATMIEQDASHRFVTDTEKTTWNGKASTAVATQSANGLMSAADKKKLDDLTGGELVIQCSIPGMN